MNQTGFNAMTQALSRLPSRRDVLRSLTGAGLGLGALRLADAEAVNNRKKGKKKKKKLTKATCMLNCTDRVCGNDGCGGSCGACGANQVCQGRTCCTPDPRSATCAGRCGAWTNNCGQPVSCANCPTGQQCLGNGSCAVVCDDNVDCPAVGGTSGCSGPTVEGAQHCIASPLLPFVACMSTLDCPPGSHCQALSPNAAVCISLSI